jgi:hypothetical protein
MKKVLLFAIAAMLATGLYAQNTLFAVNKGMVLTYRNTDDKNKTSSYQVITIKDVKGSGKNMTITYGMLMLDETRKTPKDSPGEQILTVEVKNDIVYLDMNQLVPPDLRKQGMKVEVSGIPMELPNNLQVGQKLKDANVTMKMDLGIMKMDSVLKMTDGKCLAIENLTVPAGTYKSHKITQTITSAAMGTNTVMRAVSWYAPGIGTVKTESYDSKDKLSASSVLVELKQ